MKYMKVLSDENLSLISDQLKIKDYYSENWRTYSQWEKKNITPKDGEVSSRVIFQLPVIREFDNSLSMKILADGRVVPELQSVPMNLFHKSQVREKKVANIRDLSSYEDYEFYATDYSSELHDRVAFCTLHNVIATFENHTQQNFNIEVWHNEVVSLNEVDEEITGERIMMNILETVIRMIDFKDSQHIDDEDGKFGYAENLVKISTCTYWLGKLRKDHQKKIKKVFEKTSGKFYFQPDQRCEFSDAIIEEDPRIASEVLPFSEWMKQQKDLKKVA